MTKKTTTPGVGNTEPEIFIPPEYRLHTFTVTSDGVSKTIKASAIGPDGSGERLIDEPMLEPLLTVKEQRAQR